MLMAPMLLDNGLDIFYTDTDSLKSSQKITELDRYKHLNHKNLGGLAYEETLNESIYLAPKVYGGISENGLSKVKVKGFKDKIEFNQLKDLLFKKQNIKLSQNKWFRNMLKSEIKIMKTPYLLALNENKRINNLKTLKTKPHHFERYDPENKPIK
uniref:hypothetical protein n=1 Tax=Amanita sinensis TaxID=67728 RepID=UPI001D126075|nr:hypothetical protein LK379_mgp36 [Amanita sinensis]QZN08153.1 hypothetical protein [Amanita sinensis]